MSSSNTAVSSPTGSTHPSVAPCTSKSAVFPTDVRHPIPGWPALARRIANEADFEAFPSFIDLNIKSLLYYQAQLVSLRQKLHEEESKDFYLGSGLQKLYSEDLGCLINLAPESPQYKLVEEIRTVLEKYNNALSQYSKLFEFPKADNCNVDCLRRSAMQICNDGSAVTGPGSQIWGTLSSSSDTHKSFWKLLFRLFIGLFKSLEDPRPPVDKEFQEHLIVPRLGKKPDGLTSWVAHCFIPLFHYVWRGGEPTWAGIWNRLMHNLSSCARLLPLQHQDTTKKRDSNASDTLNSEGSDFSGVGDGSVTAYSETWIFRVTSIITTIVACLLPVVAIIVLSRVQSMGMILGLIALFNTLFAFGLVLVSSGSSRVDIFTATAAFSAVMVVFVQNKIQYN
jgi:hypothetical protein